MKLLILRPVSLTLQKLWPLLALAIPLVTIVVLAGSFSDTLRQRVIIMLVNLLVVVGIYIFIGNSGVLSFGHISFMAIGAYTCAILSIPSIMKSFLMPGLPNFLQQTELGAIPAIVIAGVAAAVFALVISIPLMRLSGLAAGLATLAVLITVNVVSSQWDAVTRGAQGIQGVPTDTGMYGTLVWVLLAMTIAYLFQCTGSALRLRASREDEVSAASIGINTTLERAVAFTLSAFFVGAAGALYARFLGVFLPDTFFFQLTTITIAMLVIGGMNSLAGAVVGTVTVSAITEELRRLEEGQHFGIFHVSVRPGLQEVGLGLLMLLILLLRPRGITGGKEVAVPKFFHELQPPPAHTSATPE